MEMSENCYLLVEIKRLAREIGTRCTAERRRDLGELRDGLEALEIMREIEYALIQRIRADGEDVAF